MLTAAAAATADVFETDTIIDEHYRSRCYIDGVREGDDNLRGYCFDLKFVRRRWQHSHFEVISQLYDGESIDEEKGEAVANIRKNVFYLFNDCFPLEANEAARWFRVTIYVGLLRNRYFEVGFIGGICQQGCIFNHDTGNSLNASIGNTFVKPVNERFYVKKGIHAFYKDYSKYVNEEGDLYYRYKMQTCNLVYGTPTILYQHWDGENRNDTKFYTLEDCSCQEFISVAHIAFFTFVTLLLVTIVIVVLCGIILCHVSYQKRRLQWRLNGYINNTCNNEL